MEKQGYNMDITVQLPTSTQEYKDWYEAIIHNDTEALYIILDSNHKDILLNGQFRFDKNTEAVHSKKQRESLFTPITPICIAAASGCLDVLMIIIKEGAKVTTKDKDNYNILHCLVAMSAIYEEKEAELIGVYKQLVEFLEEGTISDLHKLEDNFGDRPLEFAAKQGTFGLMMAFFNTRGVYLDRTETRGPFKYNFYDVTDYESSSMDSRAKIRSPLSHLYNFDVCKLEDPYALAMFKDNALIRQWIKRKRQISSYLFIVWCFVRLSFFAIFLIMDSDEQWVINQGGISNKQNLSEHLSNKTYFVYCSDFTPFHVPNGFYMLSYIGVYYIVSLIIDIVAARTHYKWRKYYKSCNQTLSSAPKVTLNNQRWYNIANSLTCNGFMFSLTSYFSGTSSTTFPQFGRIMATVTFVWSPLYFVQLLPKIGLFVVGIQSMMKQVFKFSIVFIAVLVPFSQLLLVFTNTNSNEGCIEEFSSIERAAYSMMLIMQNMLNFEAFDVDKSHLFFFIHVCLIFILPIVLVNFLIAVMVASLSATEGKEHVVSDLLHLQAGLMLDSFFGRVLTKYYTWMVKRHFWVENGKVYVVTAEPAGLTKIDYSSTDTADNSK